MVGDVRGVGRQVEGALVACGMAEGDGVGGVPADDDERAEDEGKGEEDPDFGAKMGDDCTSVISVAVWRRGKSGGANDWRGGSPWRICPGGL